jgi:hypothetical protein
MSLICNAMLEPGTEVEVLLVGAEGLLAGGVARAEERLLTVIYRQAQITATRASQALEAIKMGTSRARAA